MSVSGSDDAAATELDGADAGNGSAASACALRNKQRNDATNPSLFMTISCKLMGFGDVDSAPDSAAACQGLLVTTGRDCSTHEAWAADSCLVSGIGQLSGRKALTLFRTRCTDSDAPFSSLLVPRRHEGALGAVERWADRRPPVVRPGRSECWL